MSASTPALSARGLRVQYRGTRGPVTVLDNVDVSVAAGRWTAVVGPNGAGKTTMLRALAHLLPAASVKAGDVALLGRPIASWGRTERARALAWLGQNEAPGNDLLASDVVMLGRLPHQPWLAAPSAQDQAVVERCMLQTQCSAWRERALGSLSGGERQRVLLARALAVQAQVLLMDEPLANLDAPHQADWLQLVQALVRGGGTVVSVLHELSMALQADDLVIVQNGRVVYQGESPAPATHAALVAVFDQRIEIHAVAGRWVVLPR